MNRREWLAWPLALAAAPAPAAAALSQCVVPAKPGGGFDVTCQLVQALLPSAAGPPARVYQPGGIGALTYSEVVRGARPQPREWIAFSSGSLLNLVQGRFGPWRPDRIRWVAGLAQDHGVVAVHRDAPWRSLPELLDALVRQPSAVAFATGGTIGSQDWMKSALLARAVGVSHKALRVVAFEGGGDAARALAGRHVQVLCGDAAELSEQIAAGAPLRLLATLSDHRLAGALAGVPTAAEQRVDVRWPILRGVYASADFPADELAEATQRLGEALRGRAFEQAVRRHGMEPLALLGPALAEEVERQMGRCRDQARGFGLTVAG